ncbi:MAG: MopE-related protein [Candidatus Brocadiales bacterium]
MKKVILTLNLSILALLLVFLLPRGASADIFHVTNEAELHDALFAAQSNSANDTIQIVQGTYTDNFTYAAGPLENFSLTLLGGFTPDYSSRGTNPSILDGGGSGRVLTLLTFIGNTGASVTVDGFTIRNGSTSLNGGGISAILPGPITLNNNTISGNSSTEGLGGGVYADSGDSVTLSNNVISGNTGRNGGGVYAQSSNGTITLNNNTVSGNTSSVGDGGGVYANGTNVSVTLTNNVISGNDSVRNGGGVFASVTGPTSTITFINNTVAWNSAAVDGWGLFISLLHDSATANIYNNIIYRMDTSGLDDIFISNDADDNGIASIVNICYNDFAELSGMPPLNTGLGCGELPNGNINVDPFFVDPVGGDFHLQSGSLCIDAGFNGVTGITLEDKDGNPRIMNGVVDMGAFEFKVCGDGFIDCNDPDCWVDADMDGTFAQPCGNDCDDTNPAIHPGATELCNGVDDNCDNQIDEGCPTCTDNDEDGFFIESDCGGILVDCNDNDPTVNPLVTELCDNGIDDDCDGLTDCNDTDCASDPACVTPQAETNCTDSVDDDGDGLTDCNDTDCASDPACVTPPTETNCTNSVDDDGDGLVDCNDPDCPPCTLASEICNDGIDNDSDGLVDCDDTDCVTITAYSKKSLIRFSKKISKDRASLRMCVDEDFCDAIQEGLTTMEMVLTLSGCTPKTMPGIQLKPTNERKTKFRARSASGESPKYVIKVNCNQRQLKVRLKKLELNSCVSNPVTVVKACVYIQDGPCRLCAEGELLIKRRDWDGRIKKMFLRGTETCSPR